jgi:hypothetical protein
VGLRRVFGDFFDDEVLHLIALPGDVLFPAHDDGVVAVLPPLGRDGVADDFEEGIVEREERDADGAARA